MTLREDARPQAAIAVRARRLWTDPALRAPVYAFVAAFLLYEFTQHDGFQHHNMHLYQANAFLQGRIDIPNAPPVLDVVHIGGREYSHQAPLPAVLLIPFAAVWGLGFNLRHFGALTGGVAAAAFWVLATRLGLTGWKRVAVWAGPVAGSTVWYESKEGSTWGVAAVLSVVFLTLALCEYFGRRRPFGVGMLVGLAALCRPGTSLALIGFAVAFRKRDALVRLAAGAAGAGVALLAWNYVRAGSLLDRAFDIFYKQDPFSRQRPHGPFSPAYAPLNVYSWLFLAPAFQDAAPFLRPTLMGTSLPVTSPVFLTALWARRERWIWLCLLCVVPAGLMYANGFAQFGMRYLLDAIPFLFALTCIAMADGRANGYPILLAWSIAFNALGVWYTNYNALGP